MYCEILFYFDLIVWTWEKEGDLSVIIHHANQW